MWNFDKPGKSDKLNPKKIHVKGGRIMTIKKRMPVILLTVTLMILTQIIPASAAAPKKESVEYKENGRVEVEFRSKVYYNKTSVTVKDTQGKSYKAYIVDKDNDDLEFRIRNYKEGRTYKFTIKGIKKRGTISYGKVTGTVKIPAAAAAIGKTSAYSIAKKDAESRYGADISKAELISCFLDRDDGIRVYEVEFTAYKNGVLMEFEYEIKASSGKILDCDCERYSPYDR